MTKRIKEPIRLRKRKLSDGNLSLYLDIYRNGKREYEFLKMYLVPERNKQDKEKNKDTMLLANSIKGKRILEIQAGEYGIKSNYAEDTLFFEYYKNMCEQRRGKEVGKSRGNWGNWYSCMKHLEIYEKNYMITFAEITPKWVKGFKEYLENEATAWTNDYKKRQNDRPLSANTRVSYFNKLRACLNCAFKQRIIQYNPIIEIEGFKSEEGTRMYLTIEEVKKLVKQECEYPDLKRAFLFSCLTGLRRSDIINLTWEEIHNEKDFTRIIFKQKKTGGVEYLDINKQATELLGKEGEPNEHPFYNLHSIGWSNEIIRRWVLRAGIDKDITFHCGRHTFATMMLAIGTDIYTVSKLLGHREISTTQIYAKVLDKNKQAAVNRIPDIL